VGWSLGRKSVLALGGLTLVLSLVDGFVLQRALSSSQTVSTFRDHTAAVQSSVSHIRADFYAYDGANNMYVLVAATGGAKGHALSVTTYRQALLVSRRLNREVTGAGRLLAGTGLAPAVQTMRTNLAGYDQLFEQGYREVLAGRFTAAADTVTAKNVTVSNRIGESLDAIQTRVDIQSRAQLASLSRNQHALVRIAAAALLLTALLLGGIGWAFYRAVLAPIGLLRRQIQAVDGDLTTRVEVRRQDEIGALAGEFNTFMAALHGVVSRVAGGAAELGAASAQLSGVNERIGHQAQASSTQVGLVASTAEQVSHHVQSLAAGAEQMGASIQEIAQNAHQAARVASDAVQVAEDANQAVSRLRDSSAEIGNVVKLITTIAGQTNLLALNATIEAARAGDAGRGFAVVAHEVKELAQETAQATDDISRRIAAIQADTTAAVTGTARIGEVVATINDYQGAIAAAVEQQTSTTREMTRSATQAATGSGDIAATIENVARSAHDTSSGVAESQQATSELARMSEDLRELVREFHV
jgi:methyl-accepting chemotaxis protein